MLSGRLCEAPSPCTTKVHFITADRLFGEFSGTTRELCNLPLTDGLHSWSNSIGLNWQEGRAVESASRC